MKIKVVVNSYVMKPDGSTRFNRDSEGSGPKNPKTEKNRVSVKTRRNRLKTGSNRVSYKIKKEKKSKKPNQNKSSNRSVPFPFQSSSFSFFAAHSSPVLQFFSRALMLFVILNSMLWSYGDFVFVVYGLLLFLYFI